MSWIVLVLAGITWLGGGDAPRAADVTTRWFRTQQVWGGFRPGSWKLVRVVTETIDEQGDVASSSVAETRTTLSEVSDSGVKLRVENAVHVAGKTVAAEPKEELEPIDADQTPSGSDPDSATLTIDGRDYECSVARVERVDNGQRTITTSWTTDVPPHLLRRETETTDVVSGEQVKNVTLEVLALSSRRTILGRLRTTAEMRIVQKDYRGTTVTQAWNCPDVPGGIVDSRSEEYDANNRLRRRSQLQLVDYSAR